MKKSSSSSIPEEVGVSIMQNDSAGTDLNDKWADLSINENCQYSGGSTPDKSLYYRSSRGEY